MWFTPNDTLPSSAWNGACAEFCGASHANMKFRVYTVKPDEFDMWTKNQQQGPAYMGVAAAPAPAAPAAAGVVPAALSPAGVAPKTAAAVKAADSAAAVQVAAVPARPPVWAFPAEKIESQFGYTIPQTPIPEGNDYDDSLLPAGDPAKGKNQATPCMACHQFTTGIMVGLPATGPNLTHVGSRHTIAAGLYPNDAKHLARWIKNSGHMKPGSRMPPIGKGQMDVNTAKASAMGMYSDAQIADIVAYLQLLK